MPIIIRGYFVGCFSVVPCLVSFRCSFVVVVVVAVFVGFFCCGDGGGFI